MPEKRLISFRTLQSICEDRSWFRGVDWGKISYCSRLEDLGEKKERCNANNCPIWRRAKTGSGAWKALAEKRGRMIDKFKKECKK